MGALYFPQGVDKKGIRSVISKEGSKGKGDNKRMDAVSSPQGVEEKGIRSVIIEGEQGEYKITIRWMRYPLPREWNKKG